MLELDLNPCLPSSEAIALHTPRDLPATMGRRGALWVALVLLQEPGPASLHLRVLHSGKGLAASYTLLHLPGAGQDWAGVMLHPSVSSKAAGASAPARSRPVGRRT